MIATLLVLGQLGAAPKILFVGNSHTYVNNVPQSVQMLLSSDGSHRRPIVKSVSVSLLEDSGNEVESAIRSDNWDAVVLQGAKVSSSHQYRYRQDRAIAIANLALKLKAQVFLCAEWPRRGWNETEFQLGVYREIQAAAKGSTIIPICEVWDASRAKLGGIDLWAGDGNHANPKGSFLSACTIYRYLVQSSEAKPSWRPAPVGQHEAEVFYAAAAENWRDHFPKRAKSN